MNVSKARNPYEDWPISICHASLYLVETNETQFWLQHCCETHSRCDSRTHSTCWPWL